MVRSAVAGSAAVPEVKSGPVFGPTRLSRLGPLVGSFTESFRPAAGSWRPKSTYRVDVGTTRSSRVSRPVRVLRRGRAGAFLRERRHWLSHFSQSVHRDMILLRF